MKVEFPGGVTSQSASQNSLVPSRYTGEVQLAAPPLHPIIVNWITPEKPLLLEWEFWLMVFTALLAGFTAWLAWETHKLRQDSVKAIKASRKSAKAAMRSVNIARQQFDASVQPILTLEFKPGYDGTSNNFGRESFNKGGELYVKNEGTTPFKITNVYVVVQRPDEEQYEVELESIRQRVVTPAFPLRETVTIEVRSRADQGAVLGLQVICSDMAGISINTYTWHPRHGLRHRVGPLPPESALE